MVIKCMECQNYVSFTAWLGEISRILNNCNCENKVQIHESHGKEIIQAKNINKILIWHDIEQDWITHERYEFLCG